MTPRYMPAMRPIRLRWHGHNAITAGGRKAHTSSTTLAYPKTPRPSRPPPPPLRRDRGRRRLVDGQVELRRRPFRSVAGSSPPLRIARATVREAYGGDARRRARDVERDEPAGGRREPRRHRADGAPSTGTGPSRARGRRRRPRPRARERRAEDDEREREEREPEAEQRERDRAVEVEPPAGPRPCAGTPGRARRSAARPRSMPSVDALHRRARRRGRIRGARWLGAARDARAAAGEGAERARGRARGVGVTTRAPSTRASSATAAACEYKDSEGVAWALKPAGDTSNLTLSDGVREWRVRHLSPCTPQGANPPWPRRSPRPTHASRSARPATGAGLAYGLAGARRRRRPGVQPRSRPWRPSSPRPGAAARRARRRAALRYARVDREPVHVRLGLDLPARDRDDAREWREGRGRSSRARRSRSARTALGECQNWPLWSLPCCAIMSVEPRRWNW